MIDESRLKELAEDFGEDEVEGLIELFVAETWEAVDQLEAMVSDSPSSELADQFHFLKGCARNLGASVFADRCEALENGQEAFTTTEYMAFRAEFARVADYLSGRGLREVG